MNSSQFGNISSAAAKSLEYYFTRTGPLMVVRETLRFIDDNFKMQGWQGASFQPWLPNKKGTRILFKSGDLMRGFLYLLQGDGVLFYNNIPYARAHNEGFQGQVTIPGHKRAKYLKVKASGRGTGRIKASISKVGESDVKQFTRNMDLVQRQFAPTETSPSPILEAEIMKWLEKDIKAILTF